MTVPRKGKITYAYQQLKATQPSEAEAFIVALGDPAIKGSSIAAALTDAMRLIDPDFKITSRAVNALRHDLFIQCISAREYFSKAEKESNVA